MIYIEVITANEDICMLGGRFTVGDVVLAVMLFCDLHDLQFRDSVIAYSWNPSPAMQNTVCKT